MGVDPEETEKDQKICMQIKLHKNFLTPEMLEHESKRLDDRHMAMARDELENLPD
jgi:hypothetical protein